MHPEIKINTKQMESIYQPLNHIKKESSETGTYSKELKEYLGNSFLASNCSPIKNDYSEKKSIEAWKRYIKESESTGVYKVLKKCYPQLNFPIKKDINKTEEYINTVLKGKDTINYYDDGVILNNAKGIKLELYGSLAGKVPVIIIPDDTDFVSLIQAFAYRNNPEPIPESMGASFINGIVNWDKIKTMKNSWISNNPFGNWAREFNENLKPYPSLYKDGLVILSTKPYSNITANELNLSEELWRAYSLIIRREHECTHLYTYKRFGVMNNNLHDELIADYMGICKALGSFNKKWLLKFMGLENYPLYSKGARLENYIHNSNISGKCFEQLITIIKNAIENIDKLDLHIRNSSSEISKYHILNSMCMTDLIEMASGKGVETLIKNLNMDGL